MAKTAIQEELHNTLEALWHHRASNSDIALTPKSGASLKFKEICYNASRIYFKLLFDERPDINYDEVQVWIQNFTGAQNMKSELKVRYGNLYSYVLSRGIVIPYCDWIYEEVIEIEGKKYTINKNTNVGYVHEV